MRTPLRIAAVLLIIALGGCSPASPVDACSLDSVGEVFDRRVRPLLEGGPSSCNQCHLSGVSLSNYVRKDPCQTMACMVALGEVDLAAPDSSKILERIRAAEPQSALITQAVIDEEAAGMLAWITHAAACQGQCEAIANPCDTGAPPWAAPESTPLGGCDEGSLVGRFDELVFKWRGRCGACHIQTGGQVPGAPAWVDFGSAERTMYNVLGIGALDLTTPRLSPFLTKPLTTAHPDGIAHGGGNKFQDTADQTYQDILQWLTEYAACHNSGEATIPVVNIAAPAADAWFGAADMVTLTGSADDPQDGTLPESAYQWSADGASVGSGSTVSVILPPGYVVVTLTATDSHGHSGARSTKVFVGGACSGADRDTVLQPHRFDRAAVGCSGGCQDRACIKTCAEKTWSADCSGCIADYLVCFEAECAEACQTGPDECGRCVTIHCAEPWSDCSGLPEPFSED